MTRIDFIGPLQYDCNVHLKYSAKNLFADHSLSFFLLQVYLYVLKVILN